MVVDSGIVRALAEDLSEEAIRAARLAAVTYGMKGKHVVMTSGSFQDQSSAGVFEGWSPDKVISYCNAALDYLADLESGETRANRRVNHFDMSAQVSGW